MKHKIIVGFTVKQILNILVKLSKYNTPLLALFNKSVAPKHPSRKDKTQRIKTSVRNTQNTKPNRILQQTLNRTLGGRLLPKILLFRRRHTLLMSTLSRVSPSLLPAWMGRPMALLNTDAVDAGARRRKVNKDPMSSGLFCSGVPVRHHLCLADRATHACRWCGKRHDRGE